MFHQVLRSIAKEFKAFGAGLVCAEMVAAVVDAVDKPVTVKMRKGSDGDHIFAVSNPLAVERADGQTVAIHRRTCVQMHEGTANILEENNPSIFQLSEMAMLKNARR